MNNNPTEKFLMELFSSDDFEKFYEENIHNIRMPTLSEYLNELCLQKNIQPRQLIDKTDVEKSFGFKIFSGSRRLSRDTALKFALGLGLSVDETQKLLTISKNSRLYPRIPRDAAIHYCINHGISYTKTQDYLYDWGMTCLGDNLKQDYAKSCSNDFAQKISPALPSELFTRYEIMERLSNTLHSDTFLVKSKESGEYLIAKLLKKSSAVISDEFAILQTLDHPLVPKAVEGFKNDSFTCIIRKYVEGLSLDKLELPLDEKEAIEICLKLCDILIYLHNQTPPVIHRDIKPQNVILDDNGDVHLIDFGISRYFSDKATNDTIFVGTSGYAPPEQYGFWQTDCRSDIYSLGILLCYLLTGGRDLSALDNLDNHILAHTIGRCAEFAPDKRYSTMEYAKSALSKALQYGLVRRSLPDVENLTVIYELDPSFEFSDGHVGSWYTRGFVDLNRHYEPPQLCYDATDNELTMDMVREAEYLVLEFAWPILVEFDLVWGPTHEAGFDLKVPWDLTKEWHTHWHPTRIIPKDAVNAEGTLFIIKLSEITHYKYFIECDPALFKLAYPGPESIRSILGLHRAYLAKVAG